MEYSMGVFQNEECDYPNKMFSTSDEMDFSFQFWQCVGNSSDFWPTNGGSVNGSASFAGFDENLYSSSENFDSNFYLSQENTNITTCSNSACFTNVSHESPQYFCDSNIVPIMNNNSESMNFCIMDEENIGLANNLFSDRGMEDAVSLESKMRTADITDLDVKMKFEVPQQQPEAVENVQNLKKRCRVPRDTPKYKKNVQANRTKRVTQTVKIDEDNNINGPNGQSSSSYSSEDDSNASQELNGAATPDAKESAALNSSGKPRASRGAATDPQSLYARKRREKINERLRILQNLVPNGTKVDISTMLEEAVHYVKFLQLQIKLLSSDEMWMYAPAYNGMDMGLYQKISPTL